MTKRVQRDLVVGGVGLAVFGLCAVIASNGRVGSVERAVFRSINDRPEWLYRPMQLFQFLGIVVVPLIVAAVFAVMRKWRMAAAVALVMPVKLFVEKIPKQLVSRSRPGTTVPHAILRGDVSPHGLSFTSGHAIIAFGIAGLVAIALPKKWGIFAFVLAGLNGLARIYLGAHNPLDIVGGAAIGLTVAMVLDLLLDVRRDFVPVPAPAPAAPAGSPAARPATA
jgi:membrane-associated phospholipid phosphatase